MVDRTEHRVGLSQDLCSGNFTDISIFANVRKLDIRRFEASVKEIQNDHVFAEITKQTDTQTDYYNPPPTRSV